jgi:serine protease Do
VTIAEIEPDKPRDVADRGEPPKAVGRAAQVAGPAVSDLTEAQKKELKLKGGVKVESATEAPRAPACAKAT